MQHPLLHTTLAAVLCASACLRSHAAVDIGGIPLAESVLVAGTPLQLNGAGLGTRLLLSNDRRSCHQNDTLDGDAASVASAAPWNDSMHFDFKAALVAASYAVGCPSGWAATDVGGVAMEDSAQVAGTSLKLNGAGVSMRLVFKIYAMGLYLADRKLHAQDVLDTPGPRRMVIVTLRNVSSADFIEAVMNDVAIGRDPANPQVSERMVALAKTIAEQPKGLRKGDVLTMDWVPDTGAVIELNGKPLTRPVHDLAFYNALLAIWLGSHPTDPSLKAKLLGASAPLRVSTN